MSLSTYFRVYFGSLFFIICVTSCIKEGSNSSIPLMKMQDLKASSAFDWKTARVVNFSISNLTPGVVRISSADGSKLFYKAYTGISSSFQVALSLPTTEKEVQINDELVTVPANNTVNYSMMNLKSQIVSNYSMFFNGTNAYIKVPNTASTIFTQVTIEAWVKLSAQQSTKIVQKADWNGFGLGVDLYNGFQAGAYLKSAQGILVNWKANRPVLNQWYHVAMTFDGSLLCLYVDGVLRNSVAATSALWPTTQQITIGSDNGVQKYFKGWIDEVSVWNVALSAQQISNNRNMPLAGNEAGLYAYWQFNEGSGTAVYDKTSHHYDGVVTNSTWNTDTSFGIDSDGDGVIDNYDDYPNDPTKAFNNYFPAGVPGSLAFEDLWPARGDYDFNDLVVDYQFKTITNSRNFVAEIDATFIIRAAGAEFENGFGFQLPVAIPDGNINVTGSKLNHNIVTLKNNGTEAGQDKTTVIVYDNVFDLMSHPGMGVGFNTTPGAPYITPDTLKLTMTFKPDTYIASDIALEQFNPFLIVNMIRGKEIHLPDYPPTSLADLTLFGTKDDNSIKQTGPYYKSKNNLPWALNISKSFSYTKETVQILTGYPYFSSWAFSGGVDNTDWYIDNPGNRNIDAIYKP